LKWYARKDPTWTDVLVFRGKMEALGGRMTQPARSSDTRQKMYLMEGERLAAPWIHNAMSCRDDEVGRDKRPCAATGAPVSGHVDLAYRTPWCAELLNRSPIVIA
jgi:hypothetical protein